MSEKQSGKFLAPNDLAFNCATINNLSPEAREEVGRQAAAFILAAVERLATVNAATKDAIDSFRRLTAETDKVVKTHKLAMRVLNRVLGIDTSVLRDGYIPTTIKSIQDEWNAGYRALKEGPTDEA